MFTFLKFSSLEFNFCSSNSCCLVYFEYVFFLLIVILVTINYWHLANFPSPLPLMIKHFQDSPDYFFFVFFKIFSLFLIFYFPIYFLNFYFLLHFWMRSSINKQSIDSINIWLAFWINSWSLTNVPSHFLLIQNIFRPALIISFVLFYL